MEILKLGASEHLGGVPGKYEVYLRSIHGRVFAESLVGLGFLVPGGLIP